MKDNIVADALSRLPMLDLDPSPMKMEQLAFENEDLPPDAFPLNYKTLMTHQQQDEPLLQKAKANKQYALKMFCGGGKTSTLIVKNDKIVVPTTLQQQCVQWYHESLCHPGESRTEQAIRQHFTWKDLKGKVEKACKTCQICQLTKKKSIKYGKLPPKVAEAEPWDILCVDMIGPYTIQHATKKTKEEEPKPVELSLWAVTMIDPATG